MFKRIARHKSILFYLLTVLVFGGFIWLMIRAGTKKEHLPASLPVQQHENTMLEQLGLTNISHPLAVLLLQILTIILVARIFGFIFKKIRQPTVIGEIIAGIFLGPSFVGTFFPEFSAFIFPENSLSNLQFLSQIGLILFMYVVGMELDLKVLRKKAKDAVIISHASIVFPFSLGIILAYFIYEGFAPTGISFLSFSLFIGISMSITAFPVLARIVQEKGLAKTKVGNIAITCAAADDITAWCLLAAVIAIVKAGSVLSSFYTIGLAVLYVLFMLRLVRPFLKKVGDKYSSREGLSKPVVAVFFITLLLSSYITEAIGIHALFGAFMAGVVMPSNVHFRSLFIEKVEDISLVLLLPLFFVFTGLRTEIGLLNGVSLWVTCLVVIAVAVVGKFFGSAFAARIVGQSWRESLMIGALMNTRGLMELVVLNIGYDLGVLGPETFAMMVIMALVTTFMTSPALTWINRWFRGRLPDVAAPVGQLGKKFSVLISFGSADRGVSLLRLASCFTKDPTAHVMVTAMHLSPSNEINQYNFIEFERESFKPIRQEAKKLKLPVNLYFKPSQDIEGEITQTANQGNFDLLLIGIGRSVFEGTALGAFFGHASRLLSPIKIYDAITGREQLFERTLFDEKVKYIVRGARLPVGILVDNKLQKVSHVLVFLVTSDDAVTLAYAARLLKDPELSVTIVDQTGLMVAVPELQITVDALIAASPGKVKLVHTPKPDRTLIRSHDLALISLAGWKNLVAGNNRWHTNDPSVLIIRPW